MRQIAPYRIETYHRTMRLMAALAWAIAMASCVGGNADSVTPPADSQTEGTIDEGTIDAPVGTACSTEPTPWCGGGTAWCYQAVCRAFCTPPSIGPKACPAGTSERHADPGQPVACVCVPD